MCRRHPSSRPDLPPDRHNSLHNDRMFVKLGQNVRLVSAKLSVKFQLDCSTSYICQYRITNERYTLCTYHVAYHVAFLLPCILYACVYCTGVYVNPTCLLLIWSPCLRSFGVCVRDTRVCSIPMFVSMRNLVEGSLMQLDLYITTFIQHGRPSRLHKIINIAVDPSVCTT